MPTLYHDNDADLVVRRIPAAIVPQWAVVADPSVFPVVLIHGALSGTMTYNATKRRHEAVIEGDAITSHLPVTSPTTGLPVYAVVVWWGANVRKALTNVVVKRVRD